MFACAIFGLYVVGVIAAVAAIKGVDTVLRFFGHDTIGRFCEKLGVGYNRRLRVKTARGYKTVIVRASR